jgi:hypothetical protein
MMGNCEATEEEEGLGVDFVKLEGYISPLMGQANILLHCDVPDELPTIEHSCPNQNSSCQDAGLILETLKAANIAVSQKQSQVNYFLSLFKIKSKGRRGLLNAVGKLAIGKTLFGLSTEAYVTEIYNKMDRLFKTYCFRKSVYVLVRQFFNLCFMCSAHLDSTIFFAQ